MAEKEYNALDSARAWYFTERGMTMNRIGHTPPAIPDAEGLTAVAEHARELSKAAVRLRHLLPERADENLEKTLRSIRGARVRYVIVWPDGELHGGWEGYYTQRPALLRRWEKVNQTDTVLRVYDIRLGEFILGDGISEV